MELKHTPGPWATHREGFSTVYIEARIGSGLVQEVAACGPTMAGPDQQSANAAAISATPEALALAQRVANLNPDCAEIGAGMLASLVEHARAVLQKASAK